MSKQALRGVNLGGWLILEKWMTPKVFADTTAVDEYTLSQTEKGRDAIASHRKAFIKESDFKWLSVNNIDVIRVPVGYWIFDSEDNLLPHIDLLDWTMNMALKYDIDVLIDLHGHKGSQNGHDHSGRIGPKNWFKYKENRLHSIAILEKLAARYAAHPKFWGLQLINEPASTLFNIKLRSFYKHASARIREIIEPRTHLIFSDAFAPRLMNGAVSKKHRPIMDVHIYQPFKPWVKYVSINIFMKWLRWQKRLITRLSKKQPIIIGEWSGVIRYEDLLKIPAANRDAFTKEYIQTQINVFEDCEAWFYWTYKTEGDGTWNYRSLVEANIIE